MLALHEVSRPTPHKVILHWILINYKSECSSPVLTQALGSFFSNQKVRHAWFKIVRKYLQMPRMLLASGQHWLSLHQPVHWAYRNLNYVKFQQAWNVEPITISTYVRLESIMMGVVCRSVCESWFVWHTQPRKRVGLHLLSFNCRYPANTYGTFTQYRFNVKPTVFDAGSTLKQRWMNAPCLLGNSSQAYSVIILII